MAKKYLDVPAKVLSSAIYKLYNKQMQNLPLFAQKGYGERNKNFKLFTSSDGHLKSFSFL
ncbi:MAG: hypothetical protein AVDCRST_MAG96-3887 [uncultured Segetibacter sp.]|uniref:Uncharacterized protein n=1 Tax=uncultured Segetibacter sp. TaxID=481133 RepID=A0A6J4TZ52_9BACT|nr:MAG: hypothetical protein AVDCRST_MAG96-3887 [uncultured Segetibacter sp.]